MYIYENPVYLYNSYYLSFLFFLSTLIVVGSGCAAMQFLICSFVSSLQNMDLLSLLQQKLCCFKQCIFDVFCWLGEKRLDKRLPGSGQAWGRGARQIVYGHRLSH